MSDILPPEIILDIFHHLDTDLSPTKRNEQLGACSLVCRSWLGPARAVLFSTICIKSDEQAEAFLELVAPLVAQGGIATRTLRFRRVGPREQLIVQVLEATVGVKVLELSGMYRLTQQVLEVAELRGEFQQTSSPRVYPSLTSMSCTGLDSLILNQEIYCLKRPIQLPFEGVVSLQVGTINAFGSHLLRPLARSRLRSLHIGSYHLRKQFIKCVDFPRLAPRLTTLALTLDEHDTSRSHASAESLVSSCSRHLKHLILDSNYHLWTRHVAPPTCDPLGLLLSLPPLARLRTLELPTLNGCGWEPVKLKNLLGSLYQLKSLKELRVKEGVRLGSITTLEGGMDLLAELERRGVALRCSEA